jgi:outer membrane lipoprotein
MSVQKTILLIILMAFFIGSCSVMSSQVRSESEPTVPYNILIEKADSYVGRTVILGGYILETNNLPDETVITVLQTPLNFRGYPKSMDRSEGKFVTTHKGKLDPDLYSRGRQITVAGRVLGSSVDQDSGCVNPCLKIESREVYIWPEFQYESYRYYGSRYGYLGYGYGYHGSSHYGYGHSNYSGCR